MSAAQVSRRFLLAGTGAAMAVPTFATTPSSDADLVRMATEIVHVDTEREKLLQPFYDDLFLEYPEDVHAQLDVLADQYEALGARIANRQAITLEGLRAKALAYLTWHDATSMDNDVGENLGISLCRICCGWGHKTHGA